MGQVGNNTVVEDLGHHQLPHIAPSPPKTKGRKNARCRNGKNGVRNISNDSDGK